MKDVLLCIDDEPLILKMLKQLFEDEYDVLTFLDPREALAEYSRNQGIIAVISDHRMPQMNGLELFKQMRAHCPERKSFNIMYSGYSELEGEMSAMIGSKVIHEFLTKTCPTRLLISTVVAGVNNMKKLNHAKAIA